MTSRSSRDQSPKPVAMPPWQRTHAGNRRRCCMAVLPLPLLLLLLLAGGCGVPMQGAHGRPVPGLDRLVELARPFVDDPQRHNGAPTRDRLPLTFLQSTGLQGEKMPTKFLYKSVTLLLRNVMPYTPLDIYIFVPEARAPPNPTVHEWSDMSRDIAVLPILAEHWHRRHRDNYMRDNKLDISDYHIMGQWRLEVPFTLCALLGYEYVWQIDSDSWIMEPYTVNMVDRLRAGHFLMAGQRILQDPPFFFNGLPELASSFIVMHDHSLGFGTYLPPGEDRFRTSSALWKHCNPPNISGLYSMTEGNNTGFDCSYVFGNFLIMNTGLWMKPLVQDFVQLCLLSGGVYRYRWIDQSVLAFVWLMFVEPEQFLLLEDVKYNHGKPGITGEQWAAAMGLPVPPQPPPPPSDQAAQG